MQSDFVLHCTSFALSVSIPQSYGKWEPDCSNCSTSCIFWGVPTTGASFLNVEIYLLLLFGKCLLHMCRHKNIYNQGVKSYVLFSKNLLGLQKCRQHLKVRNFALFMYGKMHLPSHQNHSLWYTHLTTWDQYTVFFLSFLRDHHVEWLQSDGF